MWMGRHTGLMVIGLSTSVIAKDAANWPLLLYIICVKSLLACMHAGENFQSHGFMTNTAPYMQRKLFSEQDLAISELQQRLHSQCIWARLYIGGGLHLRKVNLRKVCLRKVFQGRGECKEASISSSLHTIHLFTGKEAYGCAISTSETNFIFFLFLLNTW